MASDLSMAFLVLLERLAPEERAALLLRDVFDSGYGEIAGVLDRSEAACRRMVHRARLRVRGARARFPVAPEIKERLLGRFLAALGGGQPGGPAGTGRGGATWTSDGGGKVPSFPRVLRGAGRMVRLLRGPERKGRGLVRHRVAWINGEPALLTHAGDRVLFVTSVESDGERVRAFYRVLNPDKLRHAEWADG